MGADVPRGPWPYDGEIDLGFGGALRMAATVLPRRPIFGWVAYGGVLSETKTSLSVIPRDGLRQAVRRHHGRHERLRRKDSTTKNRARP